METQNSYSGGYKNLGPKTPEKDSNGNETVEQDDAAKTSGDSQPQEGKDVVNEQQQNDIVNGQGGEAAEEFVNMASNNTRKGNDSPFNNENGAAPGSGIASKDDDDDDEDDDDDPVREIEIGDDPDETKKKIPVM